jgi:hypothetical protein
VRVRLRTGLFVAPLALAIAFAFVGTPSRAATAGPSCGEQLEKNGKGISIKILFAKNGAVQQYVVVNSQENVEDANDMRKDLELHFGPAGINAPPLRIVSFKPGSGGMQIPDKAIDSCGRTLSFQ